MDDILLNTDGTLKIKNGDLVIGFSDQQNINDILSSSKGDWKRSPQTGLDADALINSTASDSDIKKQVQVQLTIDGFRVKDVEVTRNEDRSINIRPYAER